MEFYVSESESTLDGVWFDQDVGEWKVYIQSLDELLDFISIRGAITIKPPVDDFECPSIEAFYDE